VLFALVIAPALKAALGGLHTHIDYNRVRRDRHRGLASFRSQRSSPA